MLLKDYNSFFIGLFAAIVVVFFIYNTISFVITLSSDNDDNNQKISTNTWVMIGLLAISSIFVVVSVSYNVGKRSFLRDPSSLLSRTRDGSKAVSELKMDNPMYLAYKDYVRDIIKSGVSKYPASNEEKLELENKINERIFKKIDSLYSPLTKVYKTVQEREIAKDEKIKGRLEKSISEDMAKINNSVADSISSRDISISFSKNLEEAIKRKNLIGIDNDGNIKIWLESPASSSDEISASVTQEDLVATSSDGGSAAPAMTTSASLSECMKKASQIPLPDSRRGSVAPAMTTSAGRSAAPATTSAGTSKPPTSIRLSRTETFNRDGVNTVASHLRRAVEAMPRSTS